MNKRLDIVIDELAKKAEVLKIMKERQDPQYEQAFILYKIELENLKTFANKFLMELKLQMNQRH